MAALAGAEWPCARERLARGEGGAPVVQLVARGGVELQVPLLVHRRLVTAQAGLRERGALVRKSDGGGAGRARLHQALHEPDRSQLLARHPPSGEEEVESTALPDEPRQAHRAEVDERHADAAAEDPEDRVAGGDAQVAPSASSSPPAAACPSIAAMTGLPRARRGGHRSGSVVSERARLARGEGLQIGVGAERPPGAVEHGDRRVGVGVARRGGMRCVDGVADLRSIEGDDDDRLVGLDADAHARG